MLIGSGGAGKSTLARVLGERLRLPVYHLDALFWSPGWVQSTKEAWSALQEKLCAKPAWILDGNYSGSIDLRIPAADTIIFLDFSRTLCLYRTLKRTVLSYGRTRPDMAVGCPERIRFDYFVFLKWIWNYPRDRRPGILEKLDRVRATKEIVILRSPREVADFVSTLAAAEPTVGITAPP